MLNAGLDENVYTSLSFRMLLESCWRVYQDFNSKCHWYVQLVMPAEMIVLRQWLYHRLDGWIVSREQKPLYIGVKWVTESMVTVQLWV